MMSQTVAEKNLLNLKASAYSYKIPKNLKNILEHIFENNLKKLEK